MEKDGQITIRGTYLVSHASADEPDQRRRGQSQLMARTPVLRDIVRQHAEMAAFLWTVYDRHLLQPEENPDMDEERLARLVERLEAHLDGLRLAGDAGREIARERYEEFSEAGELFVRADARGQVRDQGPGSRPRAGQDLSRDDARQKPGHVNSAASQAVPS